MTIVLTFYAIARKSKLYNNNNCDIKISADCMFECLFFLFLALKGMLEITDITDSNFLKL